MQYRSVSVQSRHFVELNTNENLNSIERFELSTKQWPRCGLMHQFAVYFPYYFEKQFHIDCLNASWKQKAQSFCIHKYVYDRIYITYNIQHGTVHSTTPHGTTIGIWLPHVNVHILEHTHARAHTHAHSHTICTQCSSVNRAQYSTYSHENGP